MLGNVINQGLGIIAGQQKGFSWSSVAASAVGGAVGSFVGGKLDAKFASTALSPNRTNDIIKGVASGIAGNVASQLTQIAIDGRGRLNWSSVAVSGIYGVGSGLEANRRLEAERAEMGNTTSVAKSRATEPAGYFADLPPDVSPLMFSNATSALPSGARYSERMVSVIDQLDFELATQDELAAINSGEFSLMGGGSSAPLMRSPTMVVNRGWDAALNIAADPLGLLEPMQGTMAALDELNEMNVRKQIQDTRIQLKELGVENIPRDAEMLNGNGTVSTDYKATGKMLVGAYEDFVRDNRLRATWGNNYKDIRIGKSQFTVQQFEEASLNLQQNRMDKSVSRGLELLDSGKLKLQANSIALTLGNYVDKDIRTTLRNFYESEGLTESRVSRYVAVNRQITDGLLKGFPDSRLGNNLFADSSLAYKNATTEQLRRWVTIENNAMNVIIRPSTKITPNYQPGSYVIAPRDITPINNYQPKKAGKF